MDLELLRKHINQYQEGLQNDSERRAADIEERQQRIALFRSWTGDRIRGMSEEDLLEYLSKLWAMLIWGNKQYMVGKLIADNGFKRLKDELADLVWGNEPVATRWDRFRKRIKGIGPAMMSEILCHVHPKDCMLWNRRAFVGLRYLGVKDLPRYNYQLTGKKYEELSNVAKQIQVEMEHSGVRNADLLTVDYFIWDELQVEENLSQIHRPATSDKEAVQEIETADQETSQFIHNEIRDKLAEIGRWLGFTTRTEVKVANGSKVDTIWEATIGNMGRVIYVFEVQTKGSIDSLILNLLKSLNNPAVQGVVAVSDASQIEKIKMHVLGVAGLNDKLKCWDYMEVLQVYEALESVNESINSLGLVPQGFWS